MSGVEGYVESAASGLLAGLNAVALASGRPISLPPRTTAIGALAFYVSHADPAHYDPTNITFGIIEPLARAPRSKMARKLALSERALADLQRWMNERHLPLPEGPGLATSSFSPAAAPSPALGLVVDADDSRG
jgi:methylenetetrahydrofolate--tRNA-(uracil-5-)-methyltransferase